MYSHMFFLITKCAKSSRKFSFCGMEEEKGESATRIASQHFAEEIYAMVDHEKLELNTEMQSEMLFFYFRKNDK